MFLQLEMIEVKFIKKWSLGTWILCYLGIEYKTMVRPKHMKGKKNGTGSIFLFAKSQATDRWPKMSLNLQEGIKLSIFLWVEWDLSQGICCILEHIDHIQGQTRT